MKTILTIFTLLAVTLTSWATPCMPPEKIQTHIGELQAPVPQLDMTFNHLTEFIQIAHFERKLQCLDATVNFGGEREEESGTGHHIIQTDNTLEAILVWSRYLELIGDTTFQQTIANAWIYAYNFPAWNEGTDYYEVHNCAWGLAAELKYREATGDTTHQDYAFFSGLHINNTPLSFISELNVMVTGWACGNLYLYGEATGNQQYMDTACVRAQQVIDWIAMYPEYRLGLESWAMSSGTFVWGICNSLFRRDPAYGQQWIETYGPLVQVYEPSLPDWSNAWNVAYCNAQGAMFQVSGDSTYFYNHLWLTNFLLHRDKEDDGGIPASAGQGSTSVDASWTTSYLAMMGCDYYLGQPSDAGVQVILVPANTSHLPLNQPVRIRAVVGNAGGSDLVNVLVTASGIIAETTTVDIPVGENLSVDFGEWTPVTPGIDSLRVTVTAVGDTNTFNDTDFSQFYVLTGSDADNDPASELRFCTSSPGLFDLTLPQPSAVDLTLYNLLGQKVQTVHRGVLNAGMHSFHTDLTQLSSGLYLAVLKAGNDSRVHKVVITR